MVYLSVVQPYSGLFMTIVHWPMRLSFRRRFEVYQYLPVLLETSGSSPLAADVFNNVCLFRHFAERMISMIIATDVDYILMILVLIK